jgi:phosphoribosylglycinamide formyltransferase 1
VTQRLAVFASGGGSNLQALIDSFAENAPVRVVLVVSDRPAAGALERAQTAGIATRVIPVVDRATADVADDTLRALEEKRVDMVALAGYVRLVPPEVVARYRGRMVNVHPALLPAFGGKGMYGMRVHRAVLDAGCRVTGPTVHLVDEDYDRGRIVAQWPVPILDDDTPESLAARVLRVEHVLYPLAIELLAKRAVGQAISDEMPLHNFNATTDDGPDAAVMRRTLGLD